METAPGLNEKDRPNGETLSGGDATTPTPRRFRWDDSDLIQLKQRIAQQRQAKQVLSTNTTAPTTSEGASGSCDTAAQPQAPPTEKKLRTALTDRSANPVSSRRASPGAGNSVSKIPRPAQTQKKPRAVQVYKIGAERKRPPIASVPDFSKLHQEEQERIARFKKVNRKPTRPMAIALATSNLPPRHNGRATAPPEDSHKSGSSTSVPVTTETPHPSENTLTHSDLSNTSDCHEVSQLRITDEPKTSTSSSHGIAQPLSTSNAESDTTDSSAGAKDEFHADPASLARILSDQPLRLRQETDPNHKPILDAQVRHSMYVGAFGNLGIPVPENWRRITSIAAASGHTDLNELFNNERRDSIFGPPLRARGVCLDYAATPMTPRSNRIMTPAPTPASRALNTPRSRATERDAGLPVGTTPTQHSLMSTARSISNSTPAPLRAPMQISATPVSSQRAGGIMFISAQTPMSEPPFRSDALVSRQNFEAQTTPRSACPPRPTSNSQPVEPSSVHMTSSFAEITIAATATPTTLRGSIPPPPQQQTAQDLQSPPQRLYTIPATPGSKRVHFADTTDEVTPSRVQYLAPSRTITASVSPSHRILSSANLSFPSTLTQSALMTPTEGNRAQFGNFARTPSSQSIAVRTSKRNLQADFDAFSTPVMPKKFTTDANSRMVFSATAHLNHAVFASTAETSKSQSYKMDEHPIPVKRPSIVILKPQHQNGVSEIDAFAKFCETHARQCPSAPQEIEQELLSIEEQRLTHEINTMLQSSPAPGCATIATRQLCRFECLDPLSQVLNSKALGKEVFEDDEDRFDMESPPQLVSTSGSTTASSHKAICSDRLVLYSMPLSSACQS